MGFLFAYISDKDIFHKYYSKLLSKRIIQLTSVSDEAEERMLKNMRKVRREVYLARWVLTNGVGWERIHVSFAHVEWAGGGGGGVFGNRVPRVFFGVAVDRLSVVSTQGATTRSPERKCVYTTGREGGREGGGGIVLRSCSN